MWRWIGRKVQALRETRRESWGIRCRQHRSKQSCCWAREKARQAFSDGWKTVCIQKQPYLSFVWSWPRTSENLKEFPSPAGSLWYEWRFEVVGDAITLCRSYCAQDCILLHGKLHMAMHGFIWYYNWHGVHWILFSHQPSGACTILNLWAVHQMFFRVLGWCKMFFRGLDHCTDRWWRQQLNLTGQENSTGWIILWSSANSYGLV